MGRGDTTSTVGRAIWVYSDGTYRSPVALAWWTKNGKVTYAKLKAYCRGIVKSLKNWVSELDRTGGGNVQPRDPDLATRMVDTIGT